MNGRLTAAVREFGLRDGLGYLLDRLLYAYLGWGGFTRYLLTAQPVPDAAQALRLGKLTFVELHAGDPRLKDLPLDDRVLAYRFGLGAVCLAAIEDGRAVGCIWFCFGAYEEDMVRCRFDLHPRATTAWDFDVYIAPEHRLGRTFIRLWDAANAYLRTRGVCWSLSRISAYNQASLAAHRRLGARVIGRASFLSLGPLQIMWANSAPYFHLAWGEGRARLRLDAPNKP